MDKGYDSKYCDEFQNSLSSDKINRIWKSFREAGNSLEGRIAKLNFKKVLNRFNIRNEKFLDSLFERFKLDKYQELKFEKEEIDLQDLVIGMTILSRMSFQDKVKYIFYLTDLDQDGCLDLEEIENMIERVQKIFCKENSAAKVNSYSLLFDMAHRRAQRTFKQLLFLLKKNNADLKNDESSLITSDQFMEALKESRDLFHEQNFLPLNLALTEILTNVASEPSIKITEENKGLFCEFRKEIYNILNKTSENDNSNLIKYPGKIEIVRNKKIIEILPAIEKVTDKKSNKAPTKAKIGQNGRNNDFKDVGYDQKAAEQTLESYKMKVRKMIETKMDPRLNVHFQKLVRK